MDLAPPKIRVGRAICYPNHQSCRKPAHCTHKFVSHGQRTLNNVKTHHGCKQAWPNLRCRTQREQGCPIHRMHQMSSGFEQFSVHRRLPFRPTSTSCELVTNVGISLVASHYMGEVGTVHVDVCPERRNSKARSFTQAPNLSTLT